MMTWLHKLVIGPFELNGGTSHTRRTSAVCDRVDDDEKLNKNQPEYQGKDMCQASFHLHIPGQNQKILWRCCVNRERLIIRIRIGSYLVKSLSERKKSLLQKPDSWLSKLFRTKTLCFLHDVMKLKWKYVHTMITLMFGERKGWEHHPHPNR